MSTQLQTHTSQDLLPGATSMGPVTLAVSNLDQMVGFYRGGLGLHLLAENKGTATLGRQGRRGELEGKTTTHGTSPEIARCAGSG